MLALAPHRGTPWATLTPAGRGRDVATMPWSPSMSASTQGTVSHCHSVLKPSMEVASLVCAQCTAPCVHPAVLPEVEGLPKMTAFLSG